MSCDDHKNTDQNQTEIVCDYFGERDPVIVISSIKLQKKVKVYGYKKADGFKFPIDSLEINLRFDSKDYLANCKLSYNKDYKFVFNDTLIFEITDIKSKLKDHSGVVVCAMESYKVNNVLFDYNNQLVIELDDERIKSLIERIKKDSVLMKDLHLK